MLELGEWAEMPGHTRAPQQIATVAVFLPLAVTAVIVRIWIRMRLIRNLGWDDGMMITALSHFVLYCTSLMIIVANGGGTHITDPEALRIGISWTLVAEVFYLTTILFLKISLGLFLLRVTLAQWQRRVIYATMIISTVIQTYHTIFVIFSCGNPKFFVERTLARKCVPKNVELALAYEQAVVTTATDFVFALLPIAILWNAALDRRSKFSVGFVLFLGSLGSVSSIVRIKYIDGLGSHDDFFWNAANISIWSTIEMATGIIAGSLATMRPLFKKIVYKAKQITYLTGTSAADSRVSRRHMLGQSASRTENSTPRDSSLEQWTGTAEGQTFTANCVGGATPGLHALGILDNDAERGVQAFKLREEKAFRRKIRRQEPFVSRVWPFASDEDHTISKVVNVEVCVSSNVDDEPWTGGGGESWGMKMEALISSPPKARKGSKDSMPEWDRLPDLIPQSLSRKASASSHKRAASGDKTPPLLRINSR